MRAHILIMRSYNNAYINRAGLAAYKFDSIVDSMLIVVSAV